MSHLIINLCIYYFYDVVSEKLSENIQIVANEPSLAFFRIQEHVRKTLPPLVDKKVVFTMHYLYAEQPGFAYEYLTLYRIFLYCCTY